MTFPTARRIPLTNRYIQACHGTPILASAVIILVCSIFSLEVVSHMIPPVTIDAMWVEPYQFTRAQCVEQTFQRRKELGQEQVPGECEVMLGKTGGWARLCDSWTKQEFVEERGGIKLLVPDHVVQVPEHTGPIAAQKQRRPLIIPAVVLGSPGRWKSGLQTMSECLPLIENVWPIAGRRVDAAFEVLATP